MRRWDAIVERYVEEHRVAGQSLQHVNNVQRELGRFGLWVKRRRPKPSLEQIDAELISKYLQQRTKFRKKSTVCGVMSILRCAGDWLVREGFWVSNPLRWLQGPKLDPRGLAPRRIDRQAMERIWQSALDSPTEFHRHQRLAMIAILYGLGLRRGELERLNVDYWNGEQGLLFVDGRKTRWERQVPIPELVWHAVEAYLPQRHNFLERLGRIDERALFVSRSGGRLAADRISKRIHGIADRARVSLESLQQFRHSCASDLLEAGVRLPEVQQMLGHRSLGSTVRYLHFTDPQRREAANRHPLNDWLKGGTL